MINGFTEFAALWKEDLSDEVAINLIQALGTLRVAYQHIDAANQNMLLAYMASQLEKEITKPKMNEQLSYMLLTWLVKLKPDIKQIEPNTLFLCVVLKSSEDHKIKNVCEEALDMKELVLAENRGSGHQIINRAFEYF